MEKVNDLSTRFSSVLRLDMYGHESNNGEQGLYFEYGMVLLSF
jgi:hypothetical protein